MSLKGVSQELGEQRREQSLQDCVILSSGAGGWGGQDCATPLSGQHPGERDRLYEQHGGGGLLVPWEGSLGLSVVSRG